MTANDRRMTIKYHGGETIHLKIGNRDLSPQLRSADLYFRAGQTPEVVLRPIVEEVVVDLEGPTLTIAPDTAMILAHAGWASPEEVASLEAAITDLRGQVADLTEANQGLHDELQSAL